MDPTETVAIEPLGPDAAAEGLALTVEAGWNQTVDDWAFFLRHGTVFGARDPEGQVIATAALLPYSTGFAWVSLVIVAQAQRGRGLGTRMLNRCIATLRGFGLVGMLDATPAGEKVYAPLGFKPVFGLERWQGAGGGVPQHGDRVRPLATARMERIVALDATPAGEKVYAPLGFKPVFGLERWQGAGGGVPEHGDRVRPLATARMERIVALDAQAFGAQRDILLTEYRARAGTRAFELADGGGYALRRRGRIASQVGPVVAANPHDALALIDAAVASTPGPILIDVPDQWTGIAAWLRSRGFAIQRPLLRMALGRDAAYGDPARIFAIAGPEYG